MWCRFRKVAAFARLYVYGGLCVDMWCDDWYTNGHFLLFNCLLLFLANGTLYQSSKTLKTIGVQIVTGLPRLYKQCTNGVAIVKNSQKQSKHSQNSTKMTSGVPVVTCLPRLYQPYTTSVPKTAKRQTKQQKWPLVYQSSQIYQDCTNSVTIVY